jgi:prevent-host-death family protein
VNFHFAFRLAPPVPPCRNPTLFIDFLVRIQYVSSVKKVSVQDLKRQLSAWLAEAARGTQVLITRHRRPVACLSSADLQHLHLGRRFGRGSLKPLLRMATSGRYLEVLSDDRSGDPDGR